MSNSVSSPVAVSPALRSRDADAAHYAPEIRGRVPSLDGLRGFSILLVLLGHTALSDNAPHLLQPFGHFGNIGVRFFFVISGFLITTLLLREWRKSGTISLRGFYVRRVLRIFPAAYALIAAIALAAALKWIVLGSHEILYAATFTMNYHDYHLVWLGQLWSLAVEEQFYVLWPSLLLFAGPRPAFRAAAAVILLAPLIRAAMWFLLGADDTAMSKHFEAVADALATGCLLAAYYNRVSSWSFYLRLQQRAILFLGVSFGAILAGNALFLVKPAAFYIAGQSIANLGTVLCIDWAIRNPDHAFGRLLNWPPLVFVGVLSYSLYLWQNPFLLGSTGTFWTSFPQNLVFSVVMALLSYYLIERPFLRLKDTRAAASPQAGQATGAAQS